MKDIRDLLKGESLELEIKPEIEIDDSIDIVDDAQLKLNEALQDGFDSSKIDSYMEAMNGLSDAQKEAIINSSNLTAAQKQEMLARVQNTSSVEADNVATKDNSAITRDNASANLENANSDKVDTATNYDNITSTQVDTTETETNSIVTRDNASANIENSMSDTVDSVTNSVNNSTTAASRLFSIFGTGTKKAAKGLGSLFKGVGKLAKGLGKIGLILLAVEGVTKIAEGIANAWDDAHLTVEEADEALEQSISELDTAISEVEALESEIETCTERIEELQKLAKNGTISLIEQEELDKLEETNRELERKAKLAEDKKIREANEAADAATDKYNIVRGTKPDEEGIDWILAGSEDDGTTELRNVSLNDVASDYIKYIDEQNDIIEKYNEYEGKPDLSYSVDDIASYMHVLQNKDSESIIFTQDEMASYNKVLEGSKSTNPVSYDEYAQAKTYLNSYLKGAHDLFINEDYDLSGVLDAYKKVIDVGGELEGENLKNYNTLLKLQDAYHLHEYLINKTAENYKLLNEEQQRSIFNEELTEKYGADVANKILNSMTPEQVKLAMDGSLASLDISPENFSNIDDFVKAFILAFMDTIDDDLKQFEGDFSVEKFLNALDTSKYSDIKIELLELAESGELTPTTLETTEEYNELLSETGISAEQAANQILDMLSAQEKLSAAHNGLDSLATAYKEFADEEIGFVTARTLESLPDVFKNLDGFDLFSEIVGDPTSGADKIQQAFNDIVKEYLLKQDTLNGLIDASDHEIQSYIANLKQMGITNAEEIINQTMTVIDTEHDIIDQAEDEYFDAYLNYLGSLNEADLEYVQSVASKNDQLIEKLGNNYKTDYDNWYELISKKAVSYNKFVEALGSNNEILNEKFSGMPYSEDGLTKAKAQEIVKYSKSLINPNSINSWSGHLSMVDANIKNQAGLLYTQEQVKAAEEYLKICEEADAYKDTLNFDLSTIDTNFEFEFSPDTDGSGSDSDTTEIFDWIEVKIQRLTELLDTLKTTADNVYKTWGERNAALEGAINTTTTAINNQKLAEAKYLERANSVGLDPHYKGLVQKGAIDIDDIQDETLQNKISEYQEWYNKSVEARQEQEKLNNELNELKSQRFDNLVTQYDDIIGKMTTEKELLESQITLLSSAGDYDTLRNKQSAIVSGLKDELSRLNTEFAKTGIEYGTESWYDYKEQIADIEQKIIDAENELKNIDNLEFDNLKEAFDFDLSVLENGMQSIQNQVDLLEMKGMFANESYYHGMKEYTQSQLDVLVEERDQLQNILNNSLHKQGTSEWNEMYSTLMDIDLEIESMTNSLNEYDIAIRDLNWEIFEYLEEAINRITDETGYLIELLAKEDLFDKDTGKFTNYADATIALHATNYDVYKQQAQDYYEQVQDLQRQLVDGAGKDVLQQYYDMVDAHQDAVLAAEDEKQAILDLIEEGYNAQLEALQKLIDKKKEQMQAEKSLYDYQKSIEEQTDNISSLEKQKLAYQGDDSESAISKIQQIDVNLSEAREQLEETEYEKYLSDQEAMLDILSSDFEQWINERLDNEDLLLSEIVGKVEEKGDAIYTTLETIATTYGTTLSESLNTIFGSDTPFSSSLSSIGENINTGFNNVLGTETGEGLKGVESSLESGLGSVSTSISSVATAINNLVDDITSLVVDNSKPKNTVEDTKKTTDTDNKTNDKTSNNKPTTPTVPVVQKPTTSGSQNTSNSNSNNSSTNGSKTNSDDSIFISKKDSYPKEKLKRTTSIVDALKYFNYDSSFSARKKYYNALIGSGSYTGSASQNSALLKKFRDIKGYHQGGIVGGLKNIIGKNGDDSLAINTFEQGEGIIPLSLMGDWNKLIANLEPLSTSMDFLNRALIPSMKSNAGMSEINNDVTFNFTLTGINNAEDLVNEIQNNKQVQRTIQSITIGSVKPGLNNSLSRFKH